MNGVYPLSPLQRHGSKTMSRMPKSQSKTTLQYVWTEMEGVVAVHSCISTHPLPMKMQKDLVMEHVRLSSVL